MEFPFDIGLTCAPTSSLAAAWPGITALTAASLVGATNATSPRHRHAVAAASLIDNLGAASAAAQKLAGPITSATKLLQADHRVYVAYDGGAALGFIKVGRKTLFVHHRGRMVEVAPLCVLDFYVVDECRRQGVGKRLFDCMLECEGAVVAGNTSGAPLSPARLAYDRPSAMFLAFLRRHFGLVDYTPQPNNFVVFHKFFTEGAPAANEVEGGSGAGAAPLRPAVDPWRVGGRSRRIGEVEGYDALAADVSCARESLLRAAVESGALRPASTAEMLAASTLTDLGPGGGRPVMKRSTAPWAHTSSGIFPSAAGSSSTAGSGGGYDGVTTLRSGAPMMTATTRAVASLSGTVGGGATAREPYGMHPTFGTGSGLGGTASGGLARVAASLVASRAGTASSEAPLSAEEALARTIGLSAPPAVTRPESPPHMLHYGPTGASEAGRRGGSFTTSPAGAVPGQLPPTRRPLPPMPPRLSGLGPDGAPLSIADGPTPPAPASQGGGTRPLRSPLDYRGASAEAPFATENNIPDDVPAARRSRSRARG